MRCIANLDLFKPKDREAYGTLSLGFGDKAARTFQLTINDGHIALTGEKFGIILDGVPNLNEYKTPEQKALTIVFSEFVFGSVNQIYEQSGERSNKTEWNLSGGTPTLPLISTTQKRFFKAETDTQSKEFRALLGREATAKEEELLNEYESDITPRDRGFWRIR